MRLIVTILFLLSFAESAAAGPIQDAAVAHDKGDYATAFRLLRPLAEQGDTTAQALLGSLYSKGEGVPQDDTEALKWFRKAAETGLAHAQFQVGVILFLGRGVPQDYVSAHTWFNLAAAQGQKDSVEARRTAERFMTREQIAEAQKLAREWRPTR